MLASKSSVAQSRQHKPTNGYRFQSRTSPAFVRRPLSAAGPRGVPAVSRCLADEVAPREDAPAPNNAAPSYYTLYSSGGAGSAAIGSEFLYSPSSTSSQLHPPCRPLSLCELRAEFPALTTPESDETDSGDPWVLMENAGGSQVPASVADAVRDHMLRSYAQLGAGYPHSNRATVSAPLLLAMSYPVVVFVSCLYFSTREAPGRTLFSPRRSR